MKIMIMRHTGALSKRESAVDHDADRPLSRAGIDHATFIGQNLQLLNMAPDLVVCSPFLRSHSSATEICKALSSPIKAIPLTILAPGSRADELLRAKANYSDAEDDWILAVMHEPDVGAILGHLMMPNEPYPFPISPGDLFALDITLAGGSASADLLLFLAAGAFTADD